MSAALSMITQRPIQMPAYRNERIRSFALWYADNEPRISDYYNALRPYCEGEPLVDFFEFAACQHELAELRQNTRLPHRSSL